MWSAEELQQLVYDLYPNHPLELVGVHFGHCDKGKKTVNDSDAEDVRTLESTVKRARLLILPCRDLPVPVRAVSS